MIVVHLLLLISLTSEVVGKKHAECANRKVPSPFPIQSISWGKSDELVLLGGDDDLLVGHFASTHQLHIFDLRDRYVVGHQDLYDVYRYYAAFFFKHGSIHLLVYEKGYVGITTDSNEKHRRPIKNPTNHALDQSGNGTCFIGINGGKTIALDSRYQLDFVKLNKSYDHVFVVSKGKAPSTAHFSYDKHENVSDHLFSAQPSGFIHNQTMYLFDVKYSTVYVFDYKLLKSKMSSKHSFDISYKSKSFDSFICGGMSDPKIPRDPSPRLMYSVLLPFALPICVVAVLFIRRSISASLASTEGKTQNSFNSWLDESLLKACPNNTPHRPLGNSITTDATIRSKVTSAIPLKAKDKPIRPDRRTAVQIPRPNIKLPKQVCSKHLQKKKRMKK